MSLWIEFMTEPEHEGEEPEPRMVNMDLVIEFRPHRDGVEVRRLGDTPGDLVIPAHSYAWVIGKLRQTPSEYVIGGMTVEQLNAVRDAVLGRAHAQGE